MVDDPWSNFCRGLRYIPNNSGIIERLDEIPEEVAYEKEF